MYYTHAFSKSIQHIEGNPSYLPGITSFNIIWFHYKIIIILIIIIYSNDIFTSPFTKFNLSNEPDSNLTNPTDFMRFHIDSYQRHIGTSCPTHVGQTYQNIWEWPDKPSLGRTQQQRTPTGSGRKWWPARSKPDLQPKPLMSILTSRINTSQSGYGG
jgi:hypothetical protein